jgi:hypothetical protein
MKLSVSEKAHEIIRNLTFSGLHEHNLYPDVRKQIFTGEIVAGFGVHSNQGNMFNIN